MSIQIVVSHVVPNTCDMISTYYYQDRLIPRAYMTPYFHLYIIKNV